MNSTIVKYPTNLKEHSYHIPEGDYTGEVVSIRHNEKGELVIKFQITSYETADNIFIVNSNYRQNELKKLVRHLEHWKGKQFVRQWEETGEVDFESLVGEKADLVVLVGEPVNRHPEGYRSVHDIRPPGTLVEAEKFKGAEI